MSSEKCRVDERIFMLDCARKYFTPGWVKRLIDEISAAGFNVINVHFTDEVGHRLESKKFPRLAGGDHTLCTFGAEYGCPEDNGEFFYSLGCHSFDIGGDELLEHIRPYFTAIAKKARGKG